MKVGTKVKWSSQSCSCTTTKVGTIIVVVPTGRSLRSCLISEQFELFREPGGPRNHVSYVVSVPPAKGNAKAKLYWPVAKKLKEVKA